MRLDASYLHFISQQQLRVMTSIQLGMRNHEWVPAEVIGRISKLRGGETYKVLIKLLKNKFIVHTGKRYDGYKLAYLGYDYLALQTFIKRGILKDVIGKIGVGKQSDIYKCTTPQGDTVVLKLTRLGRNSFRSVKNNREYIGNRTFYNWLYLSRLSSVREFLFMQLLYQNNFKTPTPIDTNRHAIVMSLVDGLSMCHIQRIGTQEEIRSLFQKARDMLIRFAENGLIHGDYNEFNLITNDQATELTVIDFPQCISVNHPNADAYFNRDVQCVYTFFDKMVKRELNQNSEQVETKQEGEINSIPKKKYILNVADYPMPVLAEIQVKKRLDRELKTKGHITLTQEKELEKVLIEVKQNENNQEGQEDEEEEEDEEDEDEEENEEEQQEEQEGGQHEESEEKGELEDKLKQIQGQQIQNELFVNEIKKMSFDQPEVEFDLQQITKQNHEPEQIYDKQLQSLMKELNHSNLSPQFNENLQNNPLQQEENSQESEEERPEYKGLSAYQIRQKIKEEKKQQREKKKQQMTEDQFIKNAVKKSKKNDTFNLANRMIGNRGNKKKNKINAENIKYGYELM